MEVALLRARVLAVVLATVLVVGCSKATTPPPAPTSSAGETAQPVAPKATGALSEALFPQADFGLDYTIEENGKQQHVNEALLRDGNRAVAVQEGRTYATWHVRPDGVWRLDPKGGGAYLRYLPPELQDGLIWHQPSGKGEVWFRLAKCADGRCWEVTVLNGAERTRLQFQSGLGIVYAAAENLADPKANYIKRSGGKPDISSLDRAALLKAATPGPGEKPPAVSSGTADEFTKAFFAMLNGAGRPVTQADLDGNGKLYSIQGALGTWNKEDMPIYTGEGALVGTLKAWVDGEHKIEVLPIPGIPRPVVLEWHRAQGSPNRLSVWLPMTGGLGLHLQPVRGLAPHSDSTQATRVNVGDDGVITVEWDLGDPAGHTRVTRYRLQYNPPQLNQLSQTYRSTGASLARPQSAKEVLQAAFVAKWIGLDDETLRYFSGPDAARPLQEDKRISQLPYQPGQVDLGTVSPTVKSGSCFPDVTPEEPKVPGSVGFLARWTIYEGAAAVRGTVDFTLGPDGLPLIDKLEIKDGFDCGI